MFSGGQFCGIDVAGIMQIGHKFGGRSQSGRKKGSEVDTQRAKRVPERRQMPGRRTSLGLRAELTETKWTRVKVTQSWSRPLAHQGASDRPELATCTTLLFFQEPSPRIQWHVPPLPHYRGAGPPGSSGPGQLSVHCSY